LTGSSNGVHQASEGRDALRVRIEAHAIFLFRNFSQCFLLDDFALRTTSPCANLVELTRETRALKPTKTQENKVFELASAKAIKVTSIGEVGFESRDC
jgi:hypothetical protein